uniref:Uncharacterized protein n=1 Tax=Romanomermis culicivorax TaxID=13658 RepID=A0A915JKJ8_ROMCU
MAVAFGLILFYCVKGNISLLICERRGLPDNSLDFYKDPLAACGTTSTYNECLNCSKLGEKRTE